MHYSNLLLSQEEYQTIAKDELGLREQLFQSLDKLYHSMDSGDSIDTKIIGRCTRLVKVYKSLKYFFTDELRVRIVEVLMKAFRQDGKVTIPMKGRILSTIKVVLKKKWSRLSSIALDWKMFWSEAMIYITRENRSDIIAAETILLDYVKSLISFLHEMRHYFDASMVVTATDSSDELTGTVIDCAMRKLSDLNTPLCIEGVLLLLSCVPTDFNNYDAYIPKWIDIWTSIDHNSAWDCCWLIILSRAIKHSKTYDWSTLFPFLLVKTRELLHLPSTTNVKSVTFGSFPKAIPSYYMNFFGFKDLHKKLITKLVKLLFKIMIFHNKDEKVVNHEMMLLTLPITVTQSLQQRNLSFLGITPSTTPTPIHAYVHEFMLFVQSLRPFFHASNQGTFVVTLGKFLSALVTQFAKHFGTSFANQLLHHEELKTAEVVAEADERKKALYIWDSVQYLMGTSFALSIESLYTRQSSASASFIHCISTLIGLQPSYAHMIMPYFLLILDPSHATMASTTMSTPQKITLTIHTISNCIQSMLYPNAAVLLEYLPDILRLSLIGLEPSDSMKTMYTLDLYTTIFAWLPLRNSQTYREEYGQLSCIPSYVELLHPTGGQGQAATPLNTLQYQAMIDQLISFVLPTTEEVLAFETTGKSVYPGHSSAPATSTSCWLFQFFDKIFHLIAHLELKIKGARTSHTIPAVSQALGYVLQAIHPQEIALKTYVTNRLLQYIVTSAPSHASKICGKIVESIVYTHPERIREIVENIIKVRELIPTTGTGITGLSNERIAFLLVLTGASCRNSQSKHVVTLLPVLQEVLFSNYTYFIHHEDTKIRKCFGKCMKDILKGITSSYPKNVYPHYFPTTTSTNKTVALLGQPNIPSENQLDWHVPTSEVLIQLYPILASLTKSVEEEISHSLDQLSNIGATTAALPAATSTKATSGKKHEEMIGNNLSLLRRVIRGLADLIPAGPLSLPGTTEHVLSAFEGVKMDVDDDDNDEEEEEESSARNATMIRTGREQILLKLQAMNGEVYQYFVSYRYNRLYFLTSIHDVLTGHAASSVITTTSLVDTAVTTSTDPAATATATTATTVGGLQNNAFIAKQWMKVVTLLLTRYTACLKDIDNIAKYLTFNKQKEDHIMYRTIYDILRQTHSSAQVHHCWGAAAIVDDSSVGTNTVTHSMQAIVLSTTTQRLSGNEFFANPTIVSYLKNVWYWKFHNLNTNNLMNRIWLQHSIRCAEYGHQSMKQYIHVLRPRLPTTVTPEMVKTGFFYEDNILHDYREYLTTNTTSSTSNSNSAEGREKKRHKKFHSEIEIPYVKCIYQILEYARHDYDHIRPIGRKYFEKISTSLGYQLIHILHSFFAYIQSIAQQKISSSSTSLNIFANQISSLYVLCKTPSVMKRIAQDYSLKEAFLSSIMIVQQNIIEKITDFEKREKVVLSLTDTYIKYPYYWYQSFSTVHTKDTKEIQKMKELYDITIGKALHAFGMHHVPLLCGGENTPLPPQSEQEGSSLLMINTLSEGNMVSLTTNGLRFDAFYAYNILHVLDKSLFVYSPVYTGCVWQFVLQQLMTQHNQPSQLIALSMLIRLVENMKLVVSSLVPTTPIIVAERDGILSSEWYTQLQTLCNPRKVDTQDTTTATVSSFWKAMFIGLVRSHGNVNAEEGHAGGGNGGGSGHSERSQWADGIDHILHSSDYLSLVISRYTISKRYEPNICSTFVRKKMILLFEGLLLSNMLLLFPIIHETGEHATSIMQETVEARQENKLRLQAFLQGLTTLPAGTNESESRVINCLRAEIWSGIVRGLLALQYTYSLEIAVYEEILLHFMIPFLESISIEYAKDWQESLHFAYEAYPFPATTIAQHPTSSPIVKYILESFQTTLVSGNTTTSTGSANTTAASSATMEMDVEEVQVSVITTDATTSATTVTTTAAATTAVSATVTATTTTLDEGFTKQGKILMITTGLLLGNSIAHTVSTPTTRQVITTTAEHIPIAQAILTLLTSSTSATTTSDVFFNLSYRLCRMEVSSLLVILFEYVHAHQHTALQSILHKFTAYLHHENTVDVAKERKHSIETIVHFIPKVLQRMAIPEATPFIIALFPVLLDGMTHTEAEIVKTASETILYILNNLVSNAMTSPVIFHQWLTLLKDAFVQANHSTAASTSTPSTTTASTTATTTNAWRIKEVIMEGILFVMVQHWWLLSLPDRNTIKELLQLGMQDENMNVNEIALGGMVMYLSYKSSQELTKIAEIYLRNSETLATREKQKRRTAASTTTAVSSRPDAQYVNIIQMISCVLLVTPYDLPTYLPALVTSFLRHNIQYDLFKAMITKTIQLFKRTHQEYWEDFKTFFNTEQLSDLQGAGAAHYYT